MTCLELQERLFDHQAGVLPPAVAFVLEAHAAECDCCKELLRTYGRTVELAGELAVSVVPPSVEQAILRALAN